MGRGARWLIAIIATLIVLDVGAIAYELLSASSGIPLGPGTATITWQPTHDSTYRHPTPQSFTGTVAGYSISGSGVTPIPKASSLRVGGTFTLSRIQGSLDGKPFTLTVKFRIPSTGIATGTPGVELSVSGSFEGKPIQGVVRPGASTSQLRFEGSVGTYHVVGVIDTPSGRSVVTTKASFTVSKGPG